MLLAATASPAALYLLLLFVVPVLLTTCYTSLRDTQPGARGPSLANFAALLEPVYLSVFATTFRLALLTAAVCLAVGFPVALYIVSRVKARPFLLLLVSLPMWTNLLLLNYAWIVILRREGFLNHVLIGLGLIGEPAGFLFSHGAILLGLVYTHLPYAVLILYATLERQDPAQTEAARDLGAGAFQTLVRVVAPQAAGGMTVAFLFVFALGLGSYVTPELLGGGKVVMIGTLLQSQVMEMGNLPLAAAGSLCVMLVALALLAAFLFAGRQVGEERPR